MADKFKPGDIVAIVDADTLLKRRNCKEDNPGYVGSMINMAGVVTEIEERYPYSTCECYRLKDADCWWSVNWLEPLPMGVSEETLKSFDELL